MMVSSEYVPSGIDRGAEWMLAFRAGDETKFALLLQEYRAPVVAYLIRMLHDRAVAEELAQDVFLRVYRSRHYEPEASFRSWLLRIATNLARNWVRDHRAEFALLRLDHPREGASWRVPSYKGPNIEERLVSGCVLQEVRDAIEELPERHRNAVLMHKYLDMEYWEIANAQNCSVSAVKSMLFRAYENLRRRLAHLDPANNVSVFAKASRAVPR